MLIKGEGEMEEDNSGNWLINMFIIVVFIFAFTELEFSRIGGVLIMLGVVGLVGGTILHAIDNHK